MCHSVLELCMAQGWGIIGFFWGGRGVVGEVQGVPVPSLKGEQGEAVSRATLWFKKPPRGGYILRSDFFNVSASDCLPVVLTLLIDCSVRPGIFICVATGWNIWELIQAQLFPRKKGVVLAWMCSSLWFTTQSMVLARRGKKREEERVFNSHTTFESKIRSDLSAGEA